MRKPCSPAVSRLKSPPAGTTTSAPRSTRGRAAASKSAAFAHGAAISCEGRRELLTCAYRSACSRCHAANTGSIETRAIMRPSRADQCSTPSGVRTGRHPGNGEHERVEPCSSAAIALFTSSAAQRNSVRRPNQRSSCSYRRPRPRSRRRRSRSGRCAGGPGRAGSGRGRRSTASGFAPQAQLVCPSSRSSSSRTTSIATDALGYPT